MERLYKKFHNFEHKNNLFDLKDSSGVYFWDALRYSAYTQILQGRNYKKAQPQGNRYLRMLSYVIALIRFFVLICVNRNKKYMFIINPRDKINGVIIDKILDDPLNTIGVDKCLILDSSGENYFKTNNKYRKCSVLKIDNWFCKLIHKKQNIKPILELLSNEFPNVEFSEIELESYYKTFWAQYYLYHFLFSITRIKQLFFVQNGIMKGVFKAAKEKGVEIVEFQHGEFSLSHPVYSYPLNIEMLQEKTYLPDRLLTFGEFWNKNLSFPFVKIDVIGNNYYSYLDSHCDDFAKVDILVISSLIHGEVLAEFVKSICSIRKGIKFYFKLHPNEFNKFKYYKNIFSDFTNVEVVKDEQNVRQLLSKTNCVVAVQSTVEFEALSQGKKVFVLEKLDFMNLECLFGESGVYRFKDCEEFLDLLDKTRKDTLPMRSDFFAPYDKDKLYKILL